MYSVAANRVITFASCWCFRCSWCCVLSISSTTRTGHTPEVLSIAGSAIKISMKQTVNQTLVSMIRFLTHVRLWLRQHAVPVPVRRMPRALYRLRMNSKYSTRRTAMLYEGLRTAHVYNIYHTCRQIRGRFCSLE